MINGPNLYAYCGNNPVNLIDPWGLWGDWGAVGGALALAAANIKCPDNQTPYNPDKPKPPVPPQPPIPNPHNPNPYDDPRAWRRWLEHFKDWLKHFLETWAGSPSPIPIGLIGPDSPDAVEGFGHYWKDYMGGEVKEQMDRIDKGEI